MCTVSGLCACAAPNPIFASVINCSLLLGLIKRSKVKETYEMGERQETIYLAKLAEQAERYDGKNHFRFYSYSTVNISFRNVQVDS